MSKRTNIFRLLLGLVFLVSGFAKAFDVSAFADIIASYGFVGIRFVAVPIVVAEIIIGLLLILRIGEKTVSLITAVLLVVFTAVYSYGLIFKGVEDCGCFGNIKALNTSPVLFYIRNAILLFLAIDVYRFSSDVWKASPATVAMMMVIVIAASFMSGYTSDNFFGKYRKRTFEKYEVKGSALSEFAQFSNDSTYLVFLFSYSCPHCMNSIANLEMYEKTGAVDKVIALAYDNDSTAHERFDEYFQPSFEIIDYPDKSLFKLSNSFPKVYYVRNDSVIVEFTGEIPCSMIFKSLLKID